MSKTKKSPKCKECSDNGFVDGWFTNDDGDPEPGDVECLACGPMAMAVAVLRENGVDTPEKFDVLMKAVDEVPR